MFCSYVRRQLPAYANDEIEAARLREWIARHLDQCESCAKELGTFRAMRGLLVEARADAAPPTGPSWESVRARIEQRGAEGAGRRGIAVALRPVFAAAAVLVIGGGLWLAWPKAHQIVVEPSPVVQPLPAPITPPTHVANRGSKSDKVTPKTFHPRPAMVASTGHHATRSVTHKHSAVADANADGRPSLDRPGHHEVTIAVELSPNSRTGSVDAAVVDKDASSCVIDT